VGVGETVVIGDGEGSPGHRAINVSATLTELILHSPIGAVVITSGVPLHSKFELNWVIVATDEEHDVKEEPDDVFKHVSTG